MSQSRRFIETDGFPVREVNEFSAKEKGGARPPFWEMVFWWTRKPLIGARAVVAASLLPEGTDPRVFRRLIGLEGKHATPHRNNPLRLQGVSEAFARARLLDPFAGFGSIPLEAVRLGVGEVVAAELLPTAHVFLKAVLEYPKWAADKGLGERLVRDMERWGRWVAERLREDPDVTELYGDGAAVYIGTWEVKCPHCGKRTPIVGNWWLARVKQSGSEDEEEGEGAGSGTYERLAWMEPVQSGDRILVRVRDLNAELGTRQIKAKVGAKTGRVESGGKVYRVPSPNIHAGKTAVCLHCNNTIGKAGGEWFVKKVMKEWNSSLEAYLRGEITLEQLLEAPARPVLLVKVSVVDDDLKFEPCTQEDNDKLWKALEKLRQMWGDPDIPAENISPYQLVPPANFTVLLYGFGRYFKLFNPRQLLTLVKLVKLIREAGVRVEEEKLQDGWSREDAHRYAEAVTTYLAIALVRYASYSNITTPWKNYTGFGSATALLRAVNVMVFRGITMTWNWTDYNVSNYTNIGIERDINSIIDSLSYLVSAVSGSPSRVRVVHDDATRLERLGDEKFDVIVTDPPYKNDIAYTELSDFYYV